MLKLMGIKLINLYQLLAKYNAPRCRFVPSCSHFARQAIETHGFFKGVGLGVLRLCKCHPFHAGGLDEVPAAKKSR